MNTVCKAKRPKAMEKILDLKTVHQCNGCAGTSTLHPLVSVMDLSRVRWDCTQVRFGFYSVLLVKGDCRDYSYGRESCDYSNASLLFLKPGSAFEINPDCMARKEGSLLAFHTDFLYKADLGKHIQDYTFFSYNPEESLHLSCREESKVQCILSEIRQELQHPIDAFSKLLISRHIELLLDYCRRYYERQFITRSEARQALAGKLERLLWRYAREGRLKDRSFPGMTDCASELDCSEAYFLDLLRFETGLNFYEYMQSRKMDMAKTMLLDPRKNPASVTEELGYPNVQYFSYLFKKLTGLSPMEYRQAEMKSL